MTASFLPGCQLATNRRGNTRQILDKLLKEWKDPEFDVRPAVLCCAVHDIPAALHVLCCAMHAGQASSRCLRLLLARPACAGALCLLLRSAQSQEGICR